MIPAPDQDPQEAVRFLKKRHFFTTEGVVVASHEKYVDELIKMFQVEGYKPKPTPDISQWSGDDGELEPDEAHFFDRPFELCFICPLTGGTSNTACDI